jgi:membrane protein YdbS with pleckstrin-like domain
MRRTVLGVMAVFVLVALAVVAAWWRPPVGIALVAAAVVLLLFAWGWVMVGRNARSWGYAECDDELQITHGVLFRRLVSVPYGRMQFVDLTAGPLEQAYGIASVHLHTASPGTSARIPGLPKDEAARLRDALTSLGGAQAAGL